MSAAGIPTVGSSEYGAAPGLLWLFGEPGYARIRIGFPGRRNERNLTQQQRDHVEQLKRQFPEAQITVEDFFI